MLLILASIFLLFLLNLLLGSVHIPFGKIWELLWGTGAASNPDTMSNQEVIWSNILWKSRVPQALTALVAGAGLSVSGLQMQTVFRNPLAGPSVLGISSGASLGVACVVLLSGAMGGVALSRLGYMGEVALSVAAIIGALSVMALIVYVSQKGECNAAHYRCDDRLCGKCRYRCIEIFQCGRGYTGVRYLGAGQFCTCLR